MLNLHQQNLYKNNILTQTEKSTIDGDENVVEKSSIQLIAVVHYIIFSVRTIDFTIYLLF